MEEKGLDPYSVTFDIDVEGTFHYIPLAVHTVRVQDWGDGPEIDMMNTRRFKRA